MSGLHVAFVSTSFLRSHWDLEYRAWQDSDNEKTLDDRLALWAKRRDLKETSAESGFIDVFFRKTWGYVQTGQRGSETGFSLYPKFAIPGAGANGGEPGRHATLSRHEGPACQPCAKNSRPLHLYLLLRGYGTGASVPAAASPQFPYRVVIGLKLPELCSGLTSSAAYAIVRAWVRTFFSIRASFWCSNPSWTCTIPSIRQSRRRGFISRRW
jgi:hypothetical protein